MTARRLARAKTSGRDSSSGSRKSRRTQADSVVALADDARAAAGAGKPRSPRWSSSDTCSALQLFALVRLDTRAAIRLLDRFVGLAGAALAP